MWDMTENTIPFSCPNVSTFSFSFFHSNLNRNVVTRMVQFRKIFQKATVRSSISLKNYDELFNYNRWQRFEWKLIENRQNPPNIFVKNLKRNDWWFIYLKKNFNRPLKWNFPSYCISQFLSYLINIKKICSTLSSQMFSYNSVDRNVR